MRGSLPWSHIKVNRRSPLYSNVGKFKEECSVDELCEGCPIQFKIYMHYVYGLDFEEEPKFEFLQSLLELAAFESGLNIKDGDFDWIHIIRQNCSGDVRNAKGDPREKFAFRDFDHVREIISLAYKNSIKKRRRQDELNDESAAIDELNRRMELRNEPRRFRTG